MEWENKVEMVKLGNASHESILKRHEFNNYVLDNIKSFDGQAWDMFSNLVSLIPSEMNTDLEFWTQIYEYLKDIDCNDEKFGLRSGFRIALMQTICQDELKLQ